MSTKIYELPDYLKVKALEHSIKLSNRKNKVFNAYVYESFSLGEGFVWSEAPERDFWTDVIVNEYKRIHFGL